MSELDDAIREHLELKRRHGARDAELKELEDEAFGTGERSLDPFKAGAEALVKDGEEGETDKPAEPELDLDIEDLEGEAAEAEPGAPPEERADDDASEAGDAEPASEAPPGPVDEAPASQPPPAPDTPLPPPPPAPDRASELVHQPTEEHPPPEPPSEELEEELPASEPPLEEPGFDEEPAGEGESPMLYDFEADAPSAPAEEPLPPPPAAEPEDDFSEREPLPDPDDAFADLGPAESGGGGGELPLEDDDLPSEEALSHDAEGDEEGPGAVTADTSEREALGLEPTEQYTVPAEDEPAPQFEDEEEEGATDEAEGDAAEEPSSPLEETPDFLEETPEGEDDLWFEKKPPKDFDFEDE